MNWEQERYVRVYTRDTGDWLSLSFDAQAVWLMMLRKFDRGGRIQVGRGGRRMLAAVLGHPAQQERVDAALTELIADGCVVLEPHGAHLHAPRFREAQDWVAGPADRMRKHRAKKAAESLVPVTPGDARYESDAPVTPPVPPVPPVPCLPSVPVEKRVAPPPQPHPPFSASGFFARAQAARLEAGYVREKPPHPSKLSAWYSEAMSEMRGDEERLFASYERFTDDDYWGRQTPPWPFPAFMKQWSDFALPEKDETAA
jgi:hypothetical protein